ncbi:MAG: exonuclease SbcCD subunit D [Candidatus Hinthialibacter antarcticus]|nr:exonuclease SbcCD subunit D [Candidatus Hinthialibacter antarcticus]
MKNSISILHIADLHFGMENYGHTNPSTGLHTRLEDFSNSLKQAIDYAVDLPVDLAVFAGDAYKRNSPSPTEQRELVKHFQRLADAGIPVVMISGNHDIPVMHGKASSIDIFRSLRPDMIHVFVNRPTLGDAPPPIIETKNGPIAVCCLPYISPSFLLNIPQYQDLKGDDLTHAFEEFYASVIRDMQEGLPDDMPRILVSHLTVHGAQLGGYHGAPLLSDDIQIMPSNLAYSGYDYVALGHIHLHQNLSPREEVPVVYCGSIDRVDFGEAEEAKGFVVAHVRRGRSEFEYIPVNVREFVDIRIKHQEGSDITQRILEEINLEPIEGAVVRIRYEASEEEVQQMDMKAIHEALRPAHHKAGMIRIPLEKSSDRRGSQLSEDAALADALAAYLNEHEEFKPEAQALLEKAKDIEQSIKPQ